MIPFTVLVVEDEFLIRWSLNERLTEAGYRVVEAADGREARDRFAGTGVDMVLLDLKLPDADGRELLRDFRNSRPGCVIVCMSAHGTPELGRQLVREGARGFVSKPFDVDQMVRIVDDAAGHPPGPLRTE